MRQGESSSSRRDKRLDNGKAISSVFFTHLLKIYKILTQIINNYFSTVNFMSIFSLIIN